MVRFNVHQPLEISQAWTLIHSEFSKVCSHHFCECSCHKKMAFYTFYSALWSFLMHFSTLSGKETIFLLHRYSVSREKSDYVYVSAEPYAWSELKSSLSKYAKQPLKSKEILMMLSRPTNKPLSWSIPIQKLIIISGMHSKGKEISIQLLPATSKLFS